MPDATPPTARQEVIVVTVFCIVIMVCIAVGMTSFPREGRPGVFTAIAGLLTQAANATWITMDRKRRGREVGAWRFFAILLGPAVLCVYLVMEYRERSFFFLPIVVALYLLTWVAAPIVIHRILNS